MMLTEKRLERRKDLYICNIYCDSTKSPIVSGHKVTAGKDLSAIVYRDLSLRKAVFSSLIYIHLCVCSSGDTGRHLRNIQGRLLKLLFGKPNIVDKIPTWILFADCRV